MFNSLFFDSERYDLSAVGRVKMNMRLENARGLGRDPRPAQG
jgi:DNA-directed RNA polymerase subunit beta